MTSIEIKHEVTEVVRLMSLRRAQIKPRVLLARLQLLAAKIEEPEVEVPADVFEILDNDGRKMCLTALLTICAAALVEG